MNTIAGWPDGTYTSKPNYKDGLIEKINGRKKTQYLNVVVHNKVKTTRDGFKFAAVSVLLSYNNSYSY